MIGDITFAEMTAPANTPRTHTAATIGKPSRAKRSWPARLEPTDLWLMALQYAMGEKVDAIAAQFRTTSSYVCHQARAFGVTKRGRGRAGPAGPGDVEHLRRWAQRKATALRREAHAWETLATLD